MILPHLNEIATLCVAHGIKKAIISPGSRSAAISLAFENHPEVEVKVVADERSAAFIATGMAQQIGKAVALICTSGSAVYNYAPAVAEAYYQEIPLLIITADRPPEWIDQYDGQTINQEKIYGNHVKASYSLPVDLSHADAQWHNNRLINQAILATSDIPKGPVHLNVPIREPFYPTEKDKFEYPESRIIQTAHVEKSLSEEHWVQLISTWSTSQNKLLVIGQLEPNNQLSDALTRFSENTDAAIVNEITANQHSIKGIINKQDLFLQDDQALDAPDLLITIGKSLISKNLKTFLRKNPPKNHWHIHPGKRLNDSLQHLTDSFDLNVDYFITELFKRVKINKPSYKNSWLKVNQLTNKNCDSSINNLEFGELKASAALLSALPQDSQLHLANSMAVRYANFLGLKTPSVEVFCNRGTSGIDGSNGTAVGAALTTEKTVTLLTGDMAFLYDRNAFWHSYDLSNLRIMVLNNAGGGIFGMIPGPRTQLSYEKLFQTHQPLNAELTAQEYGFEYHACQTEQELNEGLKTFFEKSKQAKIIEVFSHSNKNEAILKSFKNYCLGR